ncbi:MAG TPA: hypothetical protein VNS81_08950 [Nocardioides sp.]|nr:hypothetical protein [Nocardioides sp.]
MTGLVLVVVIVVVAVLATLVELGNDRPREIPRSRATDPGAVPPAQRLGRS